MRAYLRLWLQSNEFVSSPKVKVFQMVTKTTDVTQKWMTPGKKNKNYDFSYEQFYHRIGFMF